MENTKDQEIISAPATKTDEKEHPVENKKDVEERNGKDNPVTNYTEQDLDKEQPVNLVLPTADYNTTVDYLKKLYNLSAEALGNVLSEKNVLVNELVQSGGKNTTLDSVFESNLNNPDNDFVNRSMYGDKNMAPSISKLKDQKGTVSGSMAIAMFTSALSVGETIEMPLWHSGFWIAIKPPKQAEIVALQTNIANAAVELGRETNSAVYSNYSVIANRILMDFVKTHLAYTTLSLENRDDLFKYVSCHDIPAMLLALACSMFPQGTEITRACRNASVSTEEGGPKCDYVVTGKIDPKKLLFLNRKALTTEHWNVMAKKLPNSVSVDEATEYRKTLSNLADKKVEFDTGTVKVTFTLSVPTVDRYIKDGEAWVNDIISKSQALFTDTDSKEAKDRKVDAMLTSFTLGIYSTFITAIEYNDKKVIDQPTILGILEQLSTVEKILSTYLKELRTYITDSMVAITATPSYTCPNCNEEQNTDKDSEFKNLIPLNMAETFFDLCVLRSLRAQQAIMS